MSILKLAVFFVVGVILTTILTWPANAEVYKANPFKIILHSIETDETEIVDLREYRYSSEQARLYNTSTCVVEKYPQCEVVLKNYLFIARKNLRLRLEREGKIVEEKYLAMDTWQYSYELKEEETPE